MEKAPAFRQAYLILADRDDLAFRTLLEMLDGEYTDIFLHMDSRAAGFDPARVPLLLKKSRLYQTERTEVDSEGFSMVEAELALLKTALNHGPYACYHLLSGQDLPIQKQTEIRSFLQGHTGKEFIRFSQEPLKATHKVYFENRKGSFSPAALLSRALLRLQKSASGLKKAEEIYQGEPWFTISEPLVLYALSREGWIREVFADTLNPASCWLPSLMMGSAYTDRLWKQINTDAGESNLRWIPEEGRRLLRRQDWPALQESDLLFARPFDERADADIIRHIHHEYGRD